MCSPLAPVRPGAAAFAILGAIAVLASAPSTVEAVSQDVLCVRDDHGNWGGSTEGMTHQVAPGYEAKKVLDLSSVPEEFWNQATEVRLSAYFCIRDYSVVALGKANGLDEAIEILVNGHVHRVPTGDGLPAWRDGRPMQSFMRWHDFPVPKEHLRRGPNEIVLRKAKAPGKSSPDDYLYLGIDTSVEGGNSFVRFGPQSEWRRDKLTVPGGAGEYMVRAYLIRGERGFTAVWRAEKDKADDPAGMIAYAGSHGPTARVEWEAERIDRLAPITAVVETGSDAPFSFHWLDADGTPVMPPIQAKGPRFETYLKPPLEQLPSGIELDKKVAVESVTVRATRGYHPRSPRIDMCPAIAQPAGTKKDRKPSCRITDSGKRIVIENATLRAEFRIRDRRLNLVSLYNELAAAEMIRRPDDCALFLVEVDGRRYAGSRDFTVQQMELSKPGFCLALHSAEAGVAAKLRVWTEKKTGLDPGLYMGLEVEAPSGPVDFKLAFPHLAGLAVSDDPADDYYFFPYGGGIIADTPALIRAGYGDHQALYQVMDLFSPKRGAGLAVQCLDADGRYKVLALRKHLPGRQETNGDVARPPTAPEYCWSNPLQAVPGTSLAVEYLRRTREPGESFAAKDVKLVPHPGDWHHAMLLYAEWCRTHWKFRSMPSRLSGVWNMIAAGWGKSPIYRDGKYRTDFLLPKCDCLELMSWWEWSSMGPGGFPLDQLKEKLGQAKYERWQSYLVADPVTGKLMFSNNPGDYDGYNGRWGGLPALRKAIEDYQKRGALVTLYTDPFRVDRASKCGREHGEKWGVVDPDGSYRDDYDAWRMCHDVAEYRKWVAENMARVMRETGADGIRLDEYGHRGSACFSKHHEHTYAEPGCTEWQRGVAEATRLVRNAMDEVKPDSVLTTEHPGYDFLMPHIEGCITYDLTVLASPLRPLECNLQRFYFPWCKAYELDHRGADRGHRKRFWNAVGSFGSYYPDEMYRVLKEHQDVFSSDNCRALVPTLARHVYANRFDSGGKTVWTLYNAAGHSHYGPVLRVPMEDGQQVVGLFGAQALEARRDGKETVVTLFLGRDDVACVARWSDGR